MNQSCEAGFHYCPNCDRSFDVGSLQAQVEQQTKDLRIVVEALKKLRNEAIGYVEVTSRFAGATNTAVMRLRIQEANSALEAAEKGKK